MNIFISHFKESVVQLFSTQNGALEECVMNMLCWSCLVEYLRSISLPVPVVVEDTSSSSEYGSVSPDNELCTNPFNFKPSIKCYSEREVKGHRSLFLRSAESIKIHSSVNIPYDVTVYHLFCIYCIYLFVNILLHTLLQYSCGKL